MNSVSVEKKDNSFARIMFDTDVYKDVSESLREMTCIDAVDFNKRALKINFGLLSIGIVDVNCNPIMAQPGDLDHTISCILQILENPNCFAKKSFAGFSSTK